MRKSLILQYNCKCCYNNEIRISKEVNRRLLGINDSIAGLSARMALRSSRICGLANQSLMIETQTPPHLDQAWHCIEP
ncbi:hypothetical protein N7G274_008115 [Stereocaulon virgatum]|uniref:Uncharacterized protein n=1 Tax=Stereocaulon virgatum TaxID=373712 RepID=A0ABR4A292_9LECA